MSTVDVKGGMDYARVKRHYDYDDYAEINFTATETSYICGTNAHAADPTVPLFDAKNTLFYATQDCYVRFNGATRVQHFIPNNTYMHYTRRWTTIYVVRVNSNGTLRLWIEG